MQYKTRKESHHDDREGRKGWKVGIKTGKKWIENNKMDEKKEWRLIRRIEK
jgi:hypothetical protein